MKALIKIFAMVLTLSLLAACSQEFAPNPGSLLNTDAPSFATNKDDGGDEGAAGNNLSLPVIWADGSFALRYDMNEPADLKGEYSVIAGEKWYRQDDPYNEWQAFNGDAEAFEINGPVDVTYIDWGDNLEVKAWASTAIVRVETRLYKALDIPQNAYTMMHLEGLGVDEVWGTNGKVYGSEEATIYSDQAVLVIQRITKDEPGGGEPGDLRWDMRDRMWIGDDVLDTRVWEEINGEDGPGGYGAEVNVQGVIVYGYNWDMKHEKYEPGVYRITFSLGNNGNAIFTGDTYILAAEEEEPEVGTEADDGGSSNIPGYAEIRPGLNLSYIDVMIQAKSGGGGGGGGGGHTGGSNTSHGNTGNGGSGSHGNN